MKYYPHANIVLERFSFATSESCLYPATIMSDLGITEVEFAPITIFYGGNGCGKSTILNIIGRKLQLPGCNSGNDAEGMNNYLNGCEHHLVQYLNIGGFDGHFIRSEVIMKSTEPSDSEMTRKIARCDENMSIEVAKSLLHDKFAAEEKLENQEFELPFD